MKELRVDTFLSACYHSLQDKLFVVSSLIYEVKF